MIKLKINKSIWDSCPLVLFYVPSPEQRDSGRGGGGQWKFILLLQKWRESVGKMKEKKEVVDNEKEAVCGRVAIHSHAAKIEVMTEKILEMNIRGDSRVKKDKERVE